MARMRRLQKGTNSPGVGGIERKVEKKRIDQNHLGDTASKGVGAVSGTIILSTWHRPETRRQMQQLMGPRSGLGTHHRRWVQKRGLTKVSITVFPFCHFTRRIYPLFCFNISPCELVCIICTVSSYIIHHFTIMI